MPRSLAASLSALAMAIVVLRGAVGGEPIEVVTAEAIVAMLIFAVVGYVAGWIADYLVRDSLEQNFRARMDWYRKELVQLGLDPAVDSTSEAGEPSGNREAA